MEDYSSTGLTIVVYAADFTGTVQLFCWIKPSFLLALLTVLSMFFPCEVLAQGCHSFSISKFPDFSPFSRLFQWPFSSPNLPRQPFVFH